MADKLSQEEAERLAREADAHDAAAAANFNISKGGRQGLPSALAPLRRRSGYLLSRAGLVELFMFTMPWT